jgi:hypothetical protein
MGARTLVKSLSGKIIEPVLYRHLVSLCEATGVA